MAYKKGILLGKISKVHSFEGAVTVRLEGSISYDITKWESVFIETDGRPVPFFIEYIEQSDNRTIRMKFTGCDSDNKVKEFVGCNVFLTHSDLPLAPVDDPQRLLKFAVWSDEDIEEGVITEVIENPGQLLLNIVSGSGKNILLPLHEDLIIGIDLDKKIIRMVIPEGIADIN